MTTEDESEPDYVPYTQDWECNAVFEEDDLRAFDTRRWVHVPNGAKWHRLMTNWERPGRAHRAERAYRRGKEHAGKGRTLRDKRC